MRMILTSCILILITTLMGCGKSIPPGEYPSFELEVNSVSVITGSAADHERRNASGTISLLDEKILIDFGGQEDGEYQIQNCRLRPSGERVRCKISIGTIEIPYNRAVNSLFLDKGSFALMFTN